jgi:hypothetical protein
MAYTTSSVSSSLGIPASSAPATMLSSRPGKTLVEVLAAQREKALRTDRFGAGDASFAQLGQMVAEVGL